MSSPETAEAPPGANPLPIRGPRQQGPYIPVRGDLFLHLPTDNDSRSEIHLVHHYSIENNVVKIFGLNVGNIVTPSDGWRTEPDPSAVILPFKEKVFEPLLAAADSFTRLKPGNAILGCYDGPMRAILLGGCPFQCKEGFQEDLETFTEKFQSFLDILDTEAQAIVVDRLTRTANRTPCPACIGFDVAKEDLELELDARTEAQKQGTEQIVERLNERQRIEEEACERKFRNHILGHSRDRYLHSGTEGFRKPSPFFLLTPDLEIRYRNLLFAMRVRRQQLRYDNVLVVCTLDGAVVDWPKSDMGTIFRQQARIGACQERIDRLPAATLEFWRSVPERALQDVCAICAFEKYEADDIIVGLHCKHFFHKECVEPWLKSHDYCPTCQSPIPGMIPGEEEAARDRRVWQEAKKLVEQIAATRPAAETARILERRMLRQRP